MNIKKGVAIDSSILLLMYLQLVVLEFFGYGQILNKIVVVIILFRLLFFKGRQWQFGLICGTGLCALYLCSFLFGDTLNASNAMSNFLMQLYPAVYTYYIVFLCRNQPEFIDNCLKKGFWVFNVTMCVNIVVLLMQILVPYSINAVIADSNVIGYYEDTISGLFRYASVHVLCLFTIFIVLYDISFRKQLKNKSVKNFLTILIFVTTAVSLYIAARSDNKAFFLLLPISLLAYWFAGDMHYRKKTMWICAGVFTMFLTVFLIYNVNSSIRTFIDKNFTNTINIIINAHGLGSSANGSSERIAIISYALNKGSTWLSGTGFGSSYIYSSGYLGFNHFGQADFGSILILGGILYTTLLLVYYLKSFLLIVGQSSLKSRRPLTLAILVITFCVVVYTQCFTRTNLAITMILIMLAFRVRCNDERRNHELEHTMDRGYIV